MYIDFEEYHPFTITAVNFDEDEKLTWNDEYQRLWIDTDINKKFQMDDYRDWETDRKSTRLNSSHLKLSRMPSSA